MDIVVRCLYDKMVPIAELKPHPKNPNKHTKEQIERLARILKYQGFRWPIKVSRLSGFVTAGHGRIEAAKKLGMSYVPVNFQEYDSDEQEYSDLVADNAIASWAELDLSAINSEIPALGPDFDIDLLGIEDFSLDPAEKDSVYTQKIESPIYEPTGCCPKISELFDDKRYVELLREIDASSVSEEEKKFLRLAASRHIVFDYQNIAEYYSHADVGGELRRLFENSALVIVDYDRAVELGFVELCKSLMEAE